MAQNFIYQSDIRELVFLHREKEYGAYLLRKAYDKHMALALGLAISFFTTCISIPLIINWLSPANGKAATATTPGSIKFEEINVPSKDPVIIPNTQSIASIKNLVKFLAPVIREDYKVAEEYIPKQVDFRDADVGNRTIAGNTELVGLYDENENIAVKVPEVIKEKEPVSQTYNWVEIMPAFESGGEEGFLAYLGANIRYPEVAKRAGIEGRILAQFIVSKTGKISDITIIKGIGGGCDEEAIRVLSSMPNWKPGRQNGLPVNVKMSVPISFRLK